MSRSTMTPPGSTSIDAGTERATAEVIARICHEANRAYCLTMDDLSHDPWDQARPDLRESVISGVLNIMRGVVTEPGQSHERWNEYKTKEGWTHGPVKDVDAKTHPNLMPFDQLPLSEQRKDILFLAITNAMLGRTTDQSILADVRQRVGVPAGVDPRYRIEELLGSIGQSKQVPGAGIERGLDKR